MEAFSLLLCYVLQFVTHEAGSGHCAQCFKYQYFKISQWLNIYSQMLHGDTDSVPQSAGRLRGVCVPQANKKKRSRHLRLSKLDLPLVTLI